MQKIFIIYLILFNFSYANKCILPKIIKGNIQLPKNCVYYKSISIVDSNTILDCQGSTFLNKKNLKVGLRINSKGKVLKNIIIKNCTFKNFLHHGIRVEWRLSDSKKRLRHEKIYAQTPHDITIDNVIIDDNGRSGIFLDDYVHDVTIKNSRILFSGTTGLYLEHSSKNNIILNNFFYKNGYRKKKANREAIAIDSSSSNLIKNNIFKDNASGGIYLYKNCGEQSSNNNQVIRWQHSNRNIIVNNFFENEQIGIWLSSRQSKNQKSYNCGDKPMKKGKPYFEDYANNNMVIDNIFRNILSPIINEGDYNKFIHNSCDFISKDKNCLSEPKTKREEILNKPQIGTVQIY